MVEYGGGINQGPAGQVGGGGGGGGSPNLGTETDLFAGVGNVFNDAMSWLGAQSPEVLVMLFVVGFLGLALLKRAF